MNNLFKKTIISYFQLHALWVPKEKKLLSEINRYSDELYVLCESFLSAVKLNQKLDILIQLIEDMLLPFGGILTYWEKGKFPLK